MEGSGGPGITPPILGKKRRNDREEKKPAGQVNQNQPRFSSRPGSTRFVTETEGTSEIWPTSIVLIFPKKKYKTMFSFYPQNLFLEKL